MLLNRIPSHRKYKGCLMHMKTISHKLKTDQVLHNPIQLEIPFALPVIRPSVIVVWKLCVALMIIFVFFEVPVYVMFGP